MGEATFRPARPELRATSSTLTPTERTLLSFALKIAVFAVTPAKAGVHTIERGKSNIRDRLRRIARSARWTPALAGVTSKIASGAATAECLKDVSAG